MDIQNKLHERMDFYKNAYDDTSKELKSVQKDFKKAEEMFTTEALNIFQEKVANPLTSEEQQILERKFNLNFDDLVKSSEISKQKLEKIILNLKEDNRYKEYLNLIINTDLKIVIDMEKDEVFEYLIEQKFHNNDFNNEPFIQIHKFKYQPRYWKFKKIANKKAKEFGIADYNAMFKLWSDLRICYKSLVGDRKIIDVVKECQGIENQIKNMEEKINSTADKLREAVINRLIELIKTSGNFIDDEYYINLVPLKQSFNSLKDSYNSLLQRKNSIMDNITKVEELMSVIQKGDITLNEKTFEKLFNNDDPTTPIFELIPEKDWNSVKTAFAKKGIKLKSRENYSVVRTKLSKNEKDAILKKYRAKEGEIFFDESKAKKN